MMTRKLLFSITILLVTCVTMQAQDLGKPKGGKGASRPDAPASTGEPGALLDTVFTIPDYNAELPTGDDVLRQGVSVKPVKKYHSTHMIGIRYGVNLASAQFSPDVHAGKVWCLNNYGLVYTYYNDLWDMLDNFGTQIIARLNHEGYTAEYGVDDTYYTVAELDMMTNLRFDINPLRIVANVGPYAGYRIGIDRPDAEWHNYDNRFDYGLIFGGGAGLMFGPFEFQLEMNYKWGLSSYLNTFYYSDEYWFFAYPRIFMFSGTLYYKF